MSVRGRSLGIGLAVLAGGLAASACLAVHFIVSTRLLRQWVNGTPEELFLDYDQASAWVPGTIRIRGLALRGSDANVQWRAHIDRATITISLPDLLLKRFHATRVRAEGLTFRLREKEEKKEMSAAHLALLPEIPGFSDPPVRAPDAGPPPRAPVLRSGDWSVHVENLVADPAPEIWIEIYRFQGRARVTGGFFLQPHVRARVGPAAVEFLSGAFTLGTKGTILASASGRGDCAIDAYDPDEVRGTQVWSRISGSISTQGRVEDLRFVNHFLRDIAEPRLEGGGGSARFTVRFDHGIGRGGGEMDAPGAAMRYARGTLEGRLAARLAVPRWDVALDDMDITGSRVELTGVRTAGTRHDERDWWGRFDIAPGRLREGLTAQTAVSCRDARPLYTLFRANLPGWAEGILKLEGVTGSARVRLAPGLVDVEGLDASGGKFHVAGRYRDGRDGRRGAFLVESGLLTAGIAIEGDAAHVKLLGARKWFETQGP